MPAKDFMCVSDEHTHITEQYPCVTDDLRPKWDFPEHGGGDVGCQAALRAIIGDLIFHCHIFIS